ncbi:MAG: ParB/RepB/Spo0J family partition protein [Myxococcaceae bacterium]|nr:ParB/RepB/Spo0J family partition protein [Myxococcaceae bacterium]
MEDLLRLTRQPEVRGGVTRVPVDQIAADPDQPRRHFDETLLEELASSIKTQGLLQPVLVRRDGKGYRIIAGERRWRAAQRAGLTELPVVVREASDAEAFELALVENLQRSDLSPLEEAEGYRRLVEERRWTQEQVAERVGKERSTVANALRLLGLPPEVKQLLEAGELDMGHARTLLGAGRQSDMVALAREAVKDGLSVRALEAKVKEGRPAAKPKKTEAKQSAEARQLVEDLQRRLGTKVRLIQRSSGKGTLEVDYFSYEDLDRIVKLIRR